MKVHHHPHDHRPWWRSGRVWLVFWAYSLSYPIEHAIWIHAPGLRVVSEWLGL